MQAQEVPGSLRGVGRLGRVCRFFEGGLDFDRPPEEEDRAGQKHQKFTVNEVGPAEDTLARLALLDRGLARRDEIVVHDHLAER